MKLGGRHVLLFGQILVSVLLIGWLIHLVDGQVLLETLMRLAPGLLCLSLGVFALANLLGAYRLRTILRALGVDMALGAAVKLTWLGLFASNFLPSSVGGDAVIAAVLHQRRERLGPVLSGLVLNRLINLGALILLLPLTLILADLVNLRSVILHALFWSGLLSAILLTAGIVLVFLMRSITTVSRLSAGLSRKLHVLWEIVIAARHAVVAALLISFVVLALGAAAMGILAKAQLPEAGFLAVAGIVLLLQLVQLVPITFNGIGLMESATTFCLTQIGWELHDAVAFSLAMRLLTILLSLPGLPIALSYMRTALKRN